MSTVPPLCSHSLLLLSLSRCRHKVRVRPSSKPPPPPSAAPDHAATVPGMSADGNAGYNPLVLPPAALGPSPGPMSADASNGDEDSANAQPLSPSAPPLHDTETHLRSVHALLDSLPAEFRPTQPRRPTQPTTSFAIPATTALELPSPSEEPGSATEPIRNASPWPPPLSEAPPGHVTVRGGGGTSGMPELCRMLSSLDRVDRRLFALGGHGDDHNAARSGDGDEDVAGYNGRERTSAGGDKEPTSISTADGQTPVEATITAATGIVGAGTAASKMRQARAISRLQQAWRARSSRQRAAAAEAEAERGAFFRRQQRRQEAAGTIQLAYRRAQARHRARRATEERRRWEERQRRRKAAVVVLERAWRVFEARRRAARELAEARGRAAAAVAAAARRTEDTARAAVLVQAVWRGMSARAVVARRFEASRARSRAAASVAPVAEQEPPSQPASIDTDRPLAAGATTTPRSVPLSRRSTFYNQLSQDPRRHHRLQLPEAHMAAAAALPRSQGVPLPPARSLAASHSAAVGKGERKAELSAGTQERERVGGRPLARSAGAVRPPRFADKETARIARIMKGNLQQHWASARSSTSSDDVDL